MLGLFDADLTLLLYVVPLAMTAVGCAMAAYFLWRRSIVPREHETVLSAYHTQLFVLVAISIWAFGQLATVTIDSFSWTLVGMHATAISTVWAAVAWLLFALAYTGREEWISWRTIVPISIVPFVGTVLLVSGPVHGYELVDPALIESGSQSVPAYEFGLLYWIMASHNWVLCVATVWLLFEKFLSSRNVYRNVAALNIVGGIVLNGGAVLSFLGVDPTGYLALGPIAFSMLAVVSALAMVSRRYIGLIPVDRLLEPLGSRWRSLSPMARDVIMQEMQSGVLVLDADNRIVDLNPMGRRMLGAESAHVVGERLTDVVSPELFQTDRTAFLEPETVEGRYRGVWIDLPNGTDRCFDIVFSPLGSGESTTGRVALITDVTDRERRKKQLEQKTQELARQNEQLEEFASIVSHDLRNPLSVAQGYLEVAYEAHDEQAREHSLEEVEYSLDRMEDIIEDVLTLARQGQSIGETERVSLATVARRAWDHVDTPEATLDVVEDIEVEADVDRLLNLFENCYRNAIQHGGPTVTVTVGGDGERFFVADDGPGIPPEERKDVLESGYTTDDKGTGFGLAIVAQIAEAHGWEVRVTESAPGGARFEFGGIDGAPETRVQ